MQCGRQSVTLTFDRLTLKLVCESHLMWGTFIPNLGTLGLWVLELFAMYATDGQTDRWTDEQKQRLLPIFLGWQFGLVVTRWPRSTQLRYVRPG